MWNNNILRISRLPLVFLFALMIAATAEAKEGFYLGTEMVFVDIGGTVNSGVRSLPEMAQASWLDTASAGT